MTRREQLISSFRDHEYRHAFVEEQVDALLPFQLRALREQRDWTQEELGEKCGKAQAWISKLENPNYARFSLQTLKTLARAFDVALEVRFVPFSNVVGWLSSRMPGDLQVPSFDKDAGISGGQTGTDANTSASARLTLVKEGISVPIRMEKAHLPPRPRSPMAATADSVAALA